MMRAKGLLLSLLLVMASGCGTDTKTETFTSTTNVAPDLGPVVRLTQDYLLGTWSSNCVRDPVGGTFFVIEYLQYDVNQMNRVSEYYLDPTCGSPVYRKNLESNYLFSSQGMYSETRKTIAITPESSSVLGMFTSFRGYCGDTSWRVNEERTFRDVEICGVNASVKMSLEAHELAVNSATLFVTECQPRNNRDCTVMKYSRTR